MPGRASRRRSGLTAGPVPVISTHALLGIGGLAVWGLYLATDEDSPTAAVPPERHFPRPVIVIHGIFAIVTVALVVVATFSGGS